MLDRRDFAKLSLATLAIAAAPAPARTNNKPKRLAPGDTVGLVLPASAELTGDEIAFARDQLKAIGFEVVIGAHAYDRWGYLAGHDRDRADDINKMFADDKVAGVVCFTGGWGSPTGTGHTLRSSSRPHTCSTCSTSSALARPSFCSG